MSEFRHLELCTEWELQGLSCTHVHNWDRSRFLRSPSSNLHLDSISKIPYRISQILQGYGLDEAISVCLMRCWRFTLDGMSYTRTHSTGPFIAVHLITHVGDGGWHPFRSVLHEKFKDNQLEAVADPGFPRGVDFNSPGWGANIRFSQIVPKTAWNGRCTPWRVQGVIYFRPFDDHSGGLWPSICTT